MKQIEHFMVNYMKSQDMTKFPTRNFNSKSEFDQIGSL